MHSNKQRTVRNLCLEELEAVNVNQSADQKRTPINECTAHHTATSAVPFGLMCLVSGNLMEINPTERRRMTPSGALV
jgi:hypothetical protein